MNAFSIEIFNELIKVFPEWVHFQNQSANFLELEIPSPHKSSMGGIIIQTSEDETIWLRIFPAASAYNVDTTEELISIIEGVFADKILWLICYKENEWFETTLINTSDNPFIESGSSYQLYSWSGKHDKTITI
jgi:hypothetical protein